MPHTLGRPRELRRAEEHGGDGGEEVAGSDRGRERPGLHREQDAGKPGHRGRGDQRAPHEPVGRHAGEAGRLGVAAGRVEAPAERRLLEDEPHHRGEHQQVHDDHRDAERTACARSPCTGRRTRRSSAGCRRCSSTTPVTSWLTPSVATNELTRSLTTTKPDTSPHAAQASRASERGDAGGHRRVQRRAS